MVNSGWQRVSCPVWNTFIANLPTPMSECSNDVIKQHHCRRQRRLRKRRTYQTPKSGSKNAQIRGLLQRKCLGRRERKDLRCSRLGQFRKVSRDRDVAGHSNRDERLFRAHIAAVVEVSEVEGLDRGAGVGNGHLAEN